MIKKALLIIGFCMAGTLTGMQQEKSNALPDQTLEKLKKQYKSLNRQERKLLLLKCALEGKVIQVKALIELKTPVNWTDKNKHTPLHFAAMHGRKEVVEFLLDRPDIEANAVANNGCTPLHCAVLKGHIEVVEFMLGRNDIKVNAAGNNGATPLHSAMGMVI